jgi:hypothetical protein
MQARLLQLVVLSALLFALGWLWLFWTFPAWLALAGFWAIPVVHAVFLAAEFTFASKVNRSDPTPKASSFQWVRAWGRELTIAIKVFGWWQPFRSRALPDQWTLAVPGQSGVIFIHGFGCNRGLWTLWLRSLRLEGRAFAAIDLEPVFVPIDHYAAQIDDAVARMTAVTGSPPVLVCHSMGGLAVRAWLRVASADARVAHVITLGTPHHGTWLGQFSRAINGLQMRHRGPWVRQLFRDEPIGRAARFTCWYSNCDNIVFPASSAMLAGAENRFAPGLAHLELALDAGVMRACFQTIRSL